jgi:hypothetical protein
MNYSSRFFLYAPLAMLLALATFAMTYWWTVARAIDARLAALKGHEAIPDVTLDWSQVTLSGFPFRLDIVFDGLSVKGAGAHGPFAWQSEHFAIHALTYGAQKDVFEAAGNQALSWTDAAGAAHAIAFLPASLHASAVRDAHGLSRFDVDIIDLAGRNFTAGRVQFHMRRDPDGKSIDLMASADVVQAADGIGFFGTHLSQMEAYASLSKGAVLAPLLRGDMAPASADAAWRQAGGTFTVSRQIVKGANTGTTDQFAALFSPLY